MVYFLPSDAPRDSLPQVDALRDPRDDTSDLRIFWGPDFCRLEYLVHLLETGRIREYGSAVSELASG